MRRAAVTRVVWAIVLAAAAPERARRRSRRAPPALNLTHVRFAPAPDEANMCAALDAARARRRALRVDVVVAVDRAYLARLVCDARLAARGFVSSLAAYATLDPSYSY